MTTNRLSIHSCYIMLERVYIFFDALSVYGCIIFQSREKEKWKTAAYSQSIFFCYILRKRITKFTLYENNISAIDCVNIHWFRSKPDEIIKELQCTQDARHTKTHLYGRMIVGRIAMKMTSFRSICRSGEIYSDKNCRIHHTRKYLCH